MGFPEATTWGTANPEPRWHRANLGGQGPLPPTTADLSTSGRSPSSPSGTIPRGPSRMGPWCPEQLSTPLGRPVPFPASLTPVFYSWSLGSHPNINYQLLNPGLRLTLWGESQAKRPGDSPCTGRPISPQKAGLHRRTSHLSCVLEGMSFPQALQASPTQPHQPSWLQMSTAT